MIVFSGQVTLPNCWWERCGFVELVMSCYPSRNATFDQDGKRFGERKRHQTGEDPVVLILSGFASAWFRLADRRYGDRQVTRNNCEDNRSIGKSLMLGGLTYWIHFVYMYAVDILNLGLLYHGYHDAVWKKEMVTVYCTILEGSASHFQRRNYCKEALLFLSHHQREWRNKWNGVDL